jgi:hypothetical protein
VHAPIEPAHSHFGGSVARRVLRCPASVRLVDQVPAHPRRLSSYAARGTALHTAMSLLIEGECSLDGLVGRTIDSYAFTSDDVENYLRPVLAYVDVLLDEPDAAYYLERRVEFPTVAGAFGTADLIVRIGNTIHVVDFKFGSGVRVLALSVDGDESVLNAQLMFYATAARNSLPEFFDGVEHVNLTILQPQTTDLDAEMVSTVEVTHAELDSFAFIYRAACEEALTPTARLQRGDHCRFCPAKPICPEHTKPLFDLGMFEVPAPMTATRTVPAKEAYLQALAAGLDLVEAVKEIGKALHDQAKAALHAGDVVPGYALSAGRAERHWRDETTVIGDLMRLGLLHDDVVEEILRSPKQIELRAKARGLKVPSELIVSSRSGVSLVREVNAHALIPGRGERIRAWAEVIDSIQKGDRHATTN